MKFLISAILMVGVILLLNTIINFIFVSKNNGEKYYSEYIKDSKQIEASLIKADNSKYLKAFENGDMSAAKKDDTEGYKSYLKYTALFKGIMGGYEYEKYKDSTTNRYFVITRFDQYRDKTQAQPYAISMTKNIYITVDNEELKNPNFGTIKNPIHVFGYKGINEPITINGVDKDGNAIYHNIQPSDEEYKYNVINYLTYVMPKEEFNKRFKK